MRGPGVKSTMAPQLSAENDLGEHDWAINPERFGEAVTRKSGNLPSRPFGVGQLNLGGVPRAGKTGMCSAFLISALRPPRANLRGGRDDFGTNSYMGDLFIKMANGHLARNIDELMPWAYAPQADGAKGPRLVVPTSHRQPSPSPRCKTAQAKTQWGLAAAPMSFFKYFPMQSGTPRRLLQTGRPRVGTRPEDVGEQVLMRGLDTA